MKNAIKQKNKTKKAEKICDADFDTCANIHELFRVLLLNIVQSWHGRDVVESRDGRSTFTKSFDVCTFDWGTDDAAPTG